MGTEDTDPEDGRDTEDTSMDGLLETLKSHGLARMLVAIEEDPDMFDAVIKSSTPYRAVANMALVELTKLDCVCIMFGEHYTTDLGSKAVDRLLRDRERERMWWLICNCNPYGNQ